MEADITIKDKKIIITGEVSITQLSDNKKAIRFDPKDAALRLGQKGGNDGDIFIHNHGGEETIHLGGQHAVIELGKEGHDDGDIRIYDKNNRQTIRHLGWRASGNGQTWLLSGQRHA